jgi:hypothetical protein
MNIRFVRDFRGRETQERFYRAGEVLDVDSDTAEKLIASHAAVAVEAVQVEMKIENEPVRKGRKK